MSPYSSAVSSTIKPRSLGGARSQARLATVVVGWDSVRKAWEMRFGEFDRVTISLAESHVHAEGKVACTVGIEKVELLRKDRKTLSFDATADQPFVFATAAAAAKGRLGRHAAAIDISWPRSKLTVEGSRQRRGAARGGCNARSE